MRVIPFPRARVRVETMPAPPAPWSEFAEFIALALLALILLAAPAAAREAEAPAPVRAQPGAPLMCQIVRPPARGEPDARLPVCAVPWADDDGRE